jgi:hypothetical protein
LGVWRFAKQLSPYGKPPSLKIVISDIAKVAIDLCAQPLTASLVVLFVSLAQPEKFPPVIVDAALPACRLCKRFCGTLVARRLPVTKRRRSILKIVSLTLLKFNHLDLQKSATFRELAQYLP